MISRLKKCLLIFLMFIVSLPVVFADTDNSKKDNLVNIYLFYSDTCPHCAEEEKLLDELKDKYKNIKIYRYEIGNQENSILLDEVAGLFDTTVTGVPFTVIGGKVYKGFSYENSKAKFMGTIEYYSEYGYKDIVGEYFH